MIWPIKFAAALVLLAVSRLHGASALPSGHFEDHLVTSNETQDPFADFSSIIKARQDGKVALRILPLGASIMSGQGSPEHSGIRKWVRMALRNDGYEVNMVGTRQDGTDMNDKDHEATPGALVHEIRDYLKRSLPYKPNLVMINAGTNNANTGKDVDNMYSLMEGLLNDIWNYPNMAETCVVLSTLLPGKLSSEVIARKKKLDATYRRLVTDYREKKCIYLADIDPVGSENTFLDINGPYWTDDIHPNNEGAKRCAYVFYAAIHRALTANKVKVAAPKESNDGMGCDKQFGNGIFAGGLTQRGYGEHDGIYYHDSEDTGYKLDYTSPWDRDQWRFARLFSRDYDDFIAWVEDTPNNHRFVVWRNSADGRGNFVRLGDYLNPSMYCIPRGVRWVDMNADGLDDLVCIAPNGDISVSINNGDGNHGSGKPPTFKNIGLVKTSEGPQARVRLADIDGDGRADYGVIGSDGKVRFWRNGWVKDKPEYWESLGIRSQISSGESGDAHAAGVRFEDINGDGRDDSLWLNVDGRTTTYTNARSCAQGQIGDGLNVAWRQAFRKGQSSGWTHGGLALWRADNEYADLRPRIFFARIYGSKMSYGNLAMKDYVFVEPKKIKDDQFNFRMHVFKNKGYGGTKLIMDGNKYCNMYGHSNGMEDYVWVLSTGKMTVHKNAGKTKINGDESFWDGLADMWTPPGEFDRRDLHLADWDGDGDCDIIWANPANGNVRVWLNDYPTKKTWNGAFREISTPGLSCDRRRGLGINDLAVRFADLTGNGRADYLCIAPDGHVKGSVQNNDGSFTNVGQIKVSADKDRANLRFADVNGDGKDDLVWINKFNGDVSVWYNQGRVSNPADYLGSSFSWRTVNGPVYAGRFAGTCTFLPDLDGNGRADLHEIKGSFTNQAETSFNPSCGLRDAEGDDSEGVYDPKLPIQPGNPIDGDGPGSGGPDTDCTNLDSKDWRKVTCTNKYIQSHTDYSAKDRWNGLQVGDAWSSAQDFVNCRYGAGKLEGSFSNVVSDFFHGPQAMHCHVWNADTNGCSGNSLQCKDADRYPVGYHILSSFFRIFGMNWSLYEAFGDAISFAPIESIASDFGISPQAKTTKVPVAIIVDVFVFAYGMVMGPMWNKVIVPKLGGGANPGTLKDTVNDIVKNSATLGKDIFSRVNTNPPTNEVSLQGAIRDAFKAMGESWRNSTVSMNSQLFDGSTSSISKLGSLMSDGRVLDQTVIEETERNELQARLKTVMTAFMIPLTWDLSPETYWPVVIAEKLACDKNPSKDWTGNTWHYMTSKAFGKRYCRDGESFWLVAPKDYTKTCDNKIGDANCDAFDVPPGFDKLASNSYGVSWDDVVIGSVNTWKGNNGVNGAKAPSELTNSLLDTLLDNGVRTPGTFRLPVCGMEEAINNWYEAYNGNLNPGANFPCSG